MIKSVAHRHVCAKVEYSIFGLKYDKSKTFTNNIHFSHCVLELVIPKQLTK